MKRIHGRIQVPQWDEGEVGILDENTIGDFRFKLLNDTLKFFTDSGIHFHHGMDVGARNGPATYIMSHYVDKIDAVELHPQSCDALRAKFGDKVQVINQLFGSWKPDTYKYDILVMFEVIEHMQDPLYAIETAYDLLENGGFLFLSTPEQDGKYGVNDNNHDHYWTATVQSIISRLFYDDRHWKILIASVSDGNIIHIVATKRVLS